MLQYFDPRGSDKSNKRLILKKGLFKKNGVIYSQFFGLIMLSNNQGLPSCRNVLIILQNLKLPDQKRQIFTYIYEWCIAPYL